MAQIHTNNQFLKCLADDLSIISHHITTHQKIIRIINKCIADMSMIIIYLNVLQYQSKKVVMSIRNFILETIINEPNVMSIGKNIKILGMMLPNHTKQNKSQNDYVYDKINKSLINIDNALISTPNKVKIIYYYLYLTISCDFIV